MSTNLNSTDSQNDPEIKSFQWMISRNNHKPKWVPNTILTLYLSISTRSAHNTILVFQRSEALHCNVYITGATKLIYAIIKTRTKIHFPNLNSKKINIFSVNMSKKHFKKMSLIAIYNRMHTKRILRLMKSTTQMNTVKKHLVQLWWMISSPLKLTKNKRSIPSFFAIFFDKVWEKCKHSNSAYWDPLSSL